MANVLGELFSDIASAIRGKTGDTATMKPAEFPAKIAAIETSGGSLPTGLYWEFGAIAPPSHYYQKWFEYNGELYAFANTVANPGNVFNVYKYADGLWSTIISSKEINGWSSPHSYQYIELGGLIHIVGMQNHYVFDGTTVTVKGAIAKDTYGAASFVHDGKLKAYSYTDGAVYVWDESTDTWASEATIGSKYAYYYFFTHNGIAYATYGTKLYRYENGVATQIATLSVDQSQSIVHNSCLYYYFNRLSTANFQCWSEWYKYDFSTGEEISLGYGAFGDSNGSLTIYQNRLLYLFGNPSAKTNVGIPHEVTE